MKCPNCGKYMVNVADVGQCPMWECTGSDNNGNACDTSADGEPGEMS